MRKTWLPWILTWTVIVVLLSIPGDAANPPPNCADTGGNHLNYTSSTHTYVCGISVVANTAYTNIPQTWTNHQGVSPVALSDGSSIAVNGTDANAYTLTVAGNGHTLSCPTTVSYGSYAFRFTNSGGVTGFAVNSCYHFASGTAPSWSVTNGKIDVMFCHAFDNSTLDCSASIDSR